MDFGQKRSNVPCLASQGWKRFLASLRFDERLEFNEGDIGLAGRNFNYTPGGILEVDKGIWGDVILFTNVFLAVCESQTWHMGRTSRFWVGTIRIYTNITLYDCALCIDLKVSVRSCDCDDEINRVSIPPEPQNMGRKKTRCFATF